LEDASGEWPVQAIGETVVRYRRGARLSAGRPDRKFHGDADHVRTRRKAYPGEDLPQNSMAAWPDRTWPPLGGAGFSGTLIIASE